MISAAAVVCLSLGGDRERRALQMIAEALPAVRRAAMMPDKDHGERFDATRATEGVRMHAELLVERGSQSARTYESLRFDLKRALEDFFERRAAAAFARWRDPA